jgi:hypothetical protein
LDGHLLGTGGQRHSSAAARAADCGRVPSRRVRSRYIRSSSAEGNCRNPSKGVSSGRVAGCSLGGKAWWHRGQATSSSRRHCRSSARSLVLTFMR